MPETTRSNGRRTDPNELHPRMRGACEGMLEELKNEDIPFQAFEMYRRPQRQKYLFGKRPRVTKARPWRSFHQYGCAVDFVLRVNNRWSWSQRTELLRIWWARLSDLAPNHGLVGLSFEKPHLQLEGVDMRDLREGIYPGGYDDLWAHTLIEAAERFPRGSPSHLPYLADDLTCRPPVDNNGLDEDWDEHLSS